MKAKLLGRMAALLLCVFLTVLPLTGMAYADGGDAEENPADFTILITPPAKAEGQVAAAEISVTDNTGDGFQLAHVRCGEKGKWRDITKELEKTEKKGNEYRTMQTVEESCIVFVRVVGMDGMAHEKSKFISLSGLSYDTENTETAADKSDDAAGAAAEDATDGTSTDKPAGTGTDADGASGEAADTPASAALTPDGQGTVVDHVIGQDGKEFYTITTPSESIFYLIIDNERDSDNVYFLNAVTESDLMALAEKDTEQPSESAVPEPVPVCSCKEKCVPGEVNTGCPVCVLAYKDCTGVAAAPGDQPEVKRETPDNSTILLIALAVLAVGGAGYYLKIYKPRKELDDAEDFDELTGAEEEETVNEDDLPAARPERTHYGEPDEPDEPDYPDGYGDDM